MKETFYWVKITPKVIEGLEDDEIYCCEFSFMARMLNGRTLKLKMPKNGEILLPVPLRQEVTDEDIQKAMEINWEKETIKNPKGINPYAFNYGFKSAVKWMRDKMHPVSPIEDKEFIKLHTGFDTNKEFEAYEKGRADEQTVCLNFIKNWKGSTSSIFGQIIKELFYSIHSSSIEEAIKRLNDAWGDDKDGKYEAQYKEHIKEKHPEWVEDKIKDILRRRGSLYIINDQKFYTEDSVRSTLKEALS